MTAITAHLLQTSIRQTLTALAQAGYDVQGAPSDPQALMQAILAGPTNWLTDRAARGGGVRLPLADYRENLAAIVETARGAGSRVALITAPAGWHGPEDVPPHLVRDGFVGDPAALPGSVTNVVELAEHPAELNDPQRQQQRLAPPRIRHPPPDLVEHRRHDVLVDLLCGADLVVGYNIRGFDYEVLRGYTDVDLQALPTLDLMYDLEDRLGFRPKLESVASATLGEGKSADGMQALEWWRMGEIDKIIDYCREDVRVTRDLYDFGKRNRWVRVARFGGKPRKVEVSW